MSSIRDFTVTNDGNSMVTVTAVSIVGGDDKFTVSSAPTFPVELESGESFGVSVTASSAETGEFSGSLRVASDATNAPTDKELSATFIEGPLAPNQIPGLQFWWDADQLVGYNNGDSINDWADLTIGRMMSQGTASRRPTYQTNVQNGLPSARFSKASLQNLGGNSSESATVQSVFLVARVNTATFTAPGWAIRLFSFNTSGGNSFSGIEGTQTINLAEFGPPGNPSSLYMDGVIQPGGDMGNLASHIYEQTRPVAFNTQTGAIFMAVANTPNTAGAQSMDLFEVFGYDRIIDADERSALLAYLSEKWGIPVS